MNATAIVGAVKRNVEDISKAFDLSLHNSKALAAWVSFIDIKTVVAEERVTRVLWRRPMETRSKLNTDGSGKGNPGISTAGGINCNSFASLLVVFL